MKCPYCNNEMKSGSLHSAADRAIYWKPAEGWKKNFWRLSRRNVERNGGVLVDEVDDLPFLATRNPESGYCENCKVIVTNLAGPYR